MLQEDWTHPISRPLALLSCYSYLLKPVPEPWREPDPVEDEDEETVGAAETVRSTAQTQERDEIVE